MKVGEFRHSQPQLRSALQPQLGGLGIGADSAALALNHGSPLVGLGTGIAASALLVGYGLYTRNH